MGTSCSGGDVRSVADENAPLSDKSSQIANRPARPGAIKSVGFHFFQTLFLPAESPIIKFLTLFP
jgi:hypothetical protein